MKTTVEQLSSGEWVVRDKYGTVIYTNVSESKARVFAASKNRHNPFTAAQLTAWRNSRGGKKS